MTDKPPDIATTLAPKLCPPEAVLDHFGGDADLIVGVGKGEPATVLDALEANADRLSGVKAHQEPGEAGLRSSAFQLLFSLEDDGS